MHDISNLVKEKQERVKMWVADGKSERLNREIQVNR